MYIYEVYISLEKGQIKDVSFNAFYRSNMISIFLSLHSVSGSPPSLSFSPQISISSSHTVYLYLSFYLSINPKDAFSDFEACKA